MFYEWPISTFQGGNFHELTRVFIVISVFSKYFKGKIFTNGNRFVNFMKIFSLEINPLYGILWLLY